jgi:hypothetical protein
MRNAVFILGQFLQPGVWEDVMWGDPRNGLLGEIPYGLRVAHNFRATHVFVCSAVPTHGGRKYSPDAKEFALEHMSEVQFGRRFVEGLIQIENVQNTVEEIHQADRVCKEHSIDNLFIVTTPKCASRALRDELHRKQTQGMFKGVDVFLSGSDVDFPDAKIGDVAIVEPAHRHDVARTNAHKLAAATVDLSRATSPEVYKELCNEWRTLLTKYGATIND